MQSNYASSAEEGSPSIMTATPTPVVTSTTPVVTPTTAPTPEVEEPVTPWQFTWAKLSIPLIGVESDITPYTAEQLVAGAVDPPDPLKVSWYTGVDGGIPSATATNCVNLYGHSYLSGGAVFDNLANAEPGSTAVITTGNGETLTYVFKDSFNIRKDQLITDPRLTENYPGCMYTYTCHKDGERDAAGHTVENTAVRWQLLPPAPAPAHRPQPQQR